MRGCANQGRLIRSAPVVAAIAILCLAGTALAASHGTATRARTLDAEKAGAVKARCPHGTRPAFGGFKANFSRTGGALPVGMAISGRAWRFAGANNSDSDPHSIRSLAYCSDHPAYRIRRVTKALAASTVKTIRATCPRGTELLAGGYRGKIDPTDSEPLTLVTAMKRQGARSLAITAAAIKTGGSATAIAYCGEGPRPSAHSAHAAVPGDGTGKATARCPRHTSLAFGGFVASAKLTNPGSKLVAPGRISRAGGGWVAAGVNATTTTPGTITAIAYCS
jgi:hypothetical protein